LEAAEVLPPPTNAAATMIPPTRATHHVRFIVFPSSGFEECFPILAEKEKADKHTVPLPTLSIFVIGDPSFNE
jgi:hypothetical protein